MRNQVFKNHGLTLGIVALLVFTTVTTDCRAQGRRPAPQFQPVQPFQPQPIPNPNIGNQKPGEFRKVGRLDAKDPYDVIRTNCRFKVVTFKMVKGRSYTIDLMGNYDPYLRVEDPLGNNRAQNDDGGVGLNSRMVFRPETTGNYRIIITSFSGGLGTYTLTVR